MNFTNGDICASLCSLMASSKADIFEIYCACKYYAPVFECKLRLEVSR